MTRSSPYASPESLLDAYYANKGEQSPQVEATGWLRLFALRGCKASDESYDAAERILDRAVIDVEDCAQNLLGLDIFLDDLSRYDGKARASVFGTADPEEGVITICTRAVAYLPLYRSTVMHEVAHMILHATPGRTSLTYAPSSKWRPPEEIEADRYMAKVLLPEPILYLAMVLAARLFDANVSDAFAWAKTERGRHQWRRIYFPYLLSRMCVSRDLVNVRMAQRGTFDQATFEYHRSYRLPNRFRAPTPLNMSWLMERVWERIESRNA